MKGCIKKGCGCLAATIVLVGVAVAVIIYIHQPKWHEDYGQRFLDKAYGTGPQNTCDLYLPTDAAATDNLALILYVHGGSWMSGDKKEHHGDCYKWLQKGYATATMNYSLLNQPDVSLLTMTDEIARCVDYLVQLAASQGAHIRQMAIAGTSAGGHLAMLYAYSHSHSLPLRFEAVKVGPADFRLLFPYNEKASPEDVRNFVYACTGNRTDVVELSSQQADSIKLQASPVHYINDSTALPAIFAYGEKDELIKPAHYHALQARYDSLGAHYDLIVFPNSGHLLMHDKDCSERYDSIMTSYCSTYFGY